MSPPSQEHPDKPKKPGRKVRVAFRRNRSKPPRTKDWTDQVQDSGAEEVDAVDRERVVAKGELSRRRTIIVHDDDDGASPGLLTGVVVAMRGLYADVDDGTEVHACTVRRILRTRRIADRSPVTVGDRVGFRLPPRQKGVVREGVIEKVRERRGQLQRKVGKRIHTLAANIDYALIVSSVAQPPAKPNLIDRYIVASLAGGITPIVCLNKIDLKGDVDVVPLLDLYAALGYSAIATSASAGDGIDELRDVLTDKTTVVAGQSGVGKSSLLNAIQPGLRCATADVSQQTGKGRHTTTTARLLPLDVGGYVVDTPGIRSLDLTTVQDHELELYFVDFLDHLPACGFPDCLHTHETRCAVKAAVESGKIHPQRYESYVRLMEDRRPC